MLRATLLIAGLCCVGGVAQAAVFNPHVATLANGMEVVVVPNHRAPVVSQMLWYKVGSADEPLGKSGIAHYLEHLMFKGTPTVPAGAFSKRIAAYGGRDNAFTAWDYTAYFATVAADQLPLLMAMEADRMQNLRLPVDAAMTELQVVLAERQQRIDADPHGRFAEKMQAELFPRHPYGTPIIGWRDEIARLSPTDAEEFYRQWYAPNNAVLVISGDVTPSRALALAAATFGQVPRRSVPSRGVRPALAAAAVTKQVTLRDAELRQPLLQQAWVAPSYQTDPEAAYALQVAEEILGAPEIGILYRRLVVESGLAADIGVDYDPARYSQASFSVTVTPQPKVSMTVLAEALRAELMAVYQHGVTARDVMAAKNRLRRAALFARDGLMLPGYAFGMARATGQTVAAVEAWPRHIAAVTLAQVDQALRALLAQPAAVTGQLLPAEDP